MYFKTNIPFSKTFFKRSNKSLITNKPYGTVIFEFQNITILLILSDYGTNGKSLKCRVGLMFFLITVETQNSSVCV